MMMKRPCILLVAFCSCLFLLSALFLGGQRDVLNYTSWSDVVSTIEPHEDEIVGDLRKRRKPINWQHVTTPRRHRLAETQHPPLQQHRLAETTTTPIENYYIPPEDKPCYNMNFIGIPIAKTVAESKALLPRRLARIVKCFLDDPLTPYPTDTKTRGRFTRSAIARLLSRSRTTEVEETLSKPQTKQWGLYGTHVSAFFCGRNGDYDFTAAELIPAAFIGRTMTGGDDDASGDGGDGGTKKKKVLSSVVMRRVLTELLTANGNEPQTSFRICGFKYPETENHILMTETSRYLTNDLLLMEGVSNDVDRFDNTLNGFDEWMLRHLKEFFVNYFEEYNSKPYQGYTSAAISNLYAFASSPRVKRASQMLLDFTSAIFAVQSNGLRRIVPFRRQDDYADGIFATERDTETARMALLAGNYEYLRPQNFWRPYGSDKMLLAAATGYRVPDLILDVMIEKHHNAYFQRVKHDGVEIYSSDDNYLINAGGVFNDNWAFGYNEQHGWARPTTLMPKWDRRSNILNWIRIEGHKDAMMRYNHCVAPGFACGTNVVIPATIPAACVEKKGGGWRFINFTRTNPMCPIKWGIYVALFVKDCDSGLCRDFGSNFGFFEVRDAHELTFREFKEAIVSRNRDRNYVSWGASTYVKSNGQSIEFEMIQDEKWNWSILSIGGVEQNRDIEAWPLAEGDIINAGRDGKVIVDNQYMNQRLVLDMSNPLNPKRYFTKIR